MDYGDIISVVAVVVGAVYVIVNSRSERSTKVADVAIKLVDPLSDRLEAVEAELGGCRKENELMRKCLARHGIDIVLDECPDP